MTSTNYILESDAESARLNKQAQMKHYSLERDFRNISLSGRVLDAGCGNGIACRYIADNFADTKSISGCDFSETRIQQAKELSKDYKNLEFFSCNLENIPCEENSFDTIICRYVFQHLQNPAKVAQELKRILAPNGKIYLLETDGVVLGLFSTNNELMTMLEKIKQELPLDLEIGRKLPSFLVNAGLSKVKWEAETMYFEDDELIKEQENYQERFKLSRPGLEKILHSTEKFEKFRQLYLEEMMKEESTLYYTKFIVQAQKTDTQN